MIGSFTINGKRRQIPTCWEDLTFNQYLRIMSMKNDLVETISILTGLSYDTIKKANIKGLENLLYVAKFLNSVPKIPQNPTKIGKYKLPLNSKGIFDIQFESLAQFEDLRQIMSSTEPSETGLIKSYPKMVAIYLQKLRDKKYDFDKADAMIPDIYNMPALEVISAGSFFLSKLMHSLNGTGKNSRNSNPNRKTSTGKRSKQSSGRTVRSTRQRGR